MQNSDLLVIKDLVEMLGIKDSIIHYYRKCHDNIRSLFKQKYLLRDGKYKLRWCVDPKDLPLLKERVEYAQTHRKKIIAGGHDSYSWTRTAVECLENLMVCKGCPNEFACYSESVVMDRGKPPMKWKVLAIIERYGLPNLEILGKWRGK